MVYHWVRYTNQHTVVQTHADTLTRLAWTTVPEQFSAFMYRVNSCLYILWDCRDQQEVTNNIIRMSQALRLLLLVPSFASSRTRRLL